MKDVNTIFKGGIVVISIGFELEGWLPRENWDAAADELEHLGGQGKTDCSIQVPEVHGYERYQDFEMNSPVMNRENYEERVDTLLDLLEEYGFDTDPEYCCGIHIHINYATPRYKSLTNKRLRMIAYSWEMEMKHYFLCNYQPAECREEYIFASESVISGHITDWKAKDKIGKNRGINCNKYSPLSFCHCDLYRQQKNSSRQTVEFRLFDATLDRESIKKSLRECMDYIEIVCKYQKPEDAFYEEDLAALFAPVTGRRASVAV